MISLVFLIQLAHAAEEPYSFGFPVQKMFNTGLTTGISQRGFVGLECNYSVVKKSAWMGVYSDVFYDFAQQDTTITIGPRIGKMVLGVDGGLGIRLGGVDQIELGQQFRALFNLGIASVYYRYGIWSEENTHQIGLTIKIPTILNYERRLASP